MSRNGSEAPLPTPRLDVQISAVRLAFDSLLVALEPMHPGLIATVVDIMHRFEAEARKHNADADHVRAIRQLGRWTRACLQGKQAR
jgi:hypothetical protein